MMQRQPTPLGLYILQLFCRQRFISIYNISAKVSTQTAVSNSNSDCSDDSYFFLEFFDATEKYVRIAELCKMIFLMPRRLVKYCGLQDDKFNKSHRPSPQISCSLPKRRQLHLTGK